MNRGQEREGSTQAVAVVETTADERGFERTEREQSRAVLQTGAPASMRSDS